ncbi:unnamed protein product [Moneuplotes crassus]|uniref:Uncharacterized protein n=1 Tax=Euplotes crassus TaxID=5936 RepID=A0AAD1UEV6_EUPCR|nr:unnamed protein product [Moneuplotes crassus]
MYEMLYSKYKLNPSYGDENRSSFITEILGNPKVNLEAKKGSKQKKRMTFLKDPNFVRKNRILQMCNDNKAFYTFKKLNDLTGTNNKKETQREIKEKQTVEEVIKLIKKKMKNSKERSLEKEKSDLKPPTPAHEDYDEYSFVPDSVPMKKKRKDFWGNLSNIRPSFKPQPHKTSTTVKEKEGKKVRFLPTQNEDLNFCRRMHNRSASISYNLRNTLHQKYQDSISKPLSWRREKKNLAINTDSKNLPSFPSKSKTSTPLTAQNWLTGYNIYQKAKSHNLTYLLKKSKGSSRRKRADNSYRASSCIEKDRIQRIKFKKLNSRHSSTANKIVLDCDNEKDNDCSDVLQKNLFDLFIEEMRKDKFQQTMEIIQKLEGTQSESIRRLFYLMKNFIIGERHQAESIRKEFRSGMMDPTRKAALYELILNSKRHSG